MGLKCLIVLVLFMSPSVFGRDCGNILERTTTDALHPCDECIRCGGKYCKDVSESLQCVLQSEDSWCPESQEVIPDPNTTLPYFTKGQHFLPLFVERRASVGSKTYIDIKFFNIPTVKTHLVPLRRIINATQPTTDAVHIKVNITKGTTIRVETIVGTDFCSPNSTKFEYINVEVRLNVVTNESVLLKYEVPCACGCSDEDVEKDSLQCSGFGDLSYGVCHCRGKRTGTRCEKKNCKDRGDTPPTCFNPSKPATPCSGNGRCNECNECECFTDFDIEGSQYFNADHNCEDLCSATSKCSDCLKTNEPGVCDFCETPFVHITNASTSVLEEVEKGRKVWVQCNVTVPDCGQVEYAAMERNGEKLVMILKACDATYLGVAGGPVNVSVLAGVLAMLVVMIGAGVAFVVWKGAAAAVPLASPEYSNIDAEDCTGVNPLYKPPTSSFKNPMYGKA